MIDISSHRQYLASIQCGWCVSTPRIKRRTKVRERLTKIRPIELFQCFHLKKNNKEYVRQVSQNGLLCRLARYWNQLALSKHKDKLSRRLCKITCKRYTLLRLLTAAKSPKLHNSWHRHEPRLICHTSLPKRFVWKHLRVEGLLHRCILASSWMRMSTVRHKSWRKLQRYLSMKTQIRLARQQPHKKSTLIKKAKSMNMRNLRPRSRNKIAMLEAQVDSQACSTNWPSVYSGKLKSPSSNNTVDQRSISRTLKLEWRIMTASSNAPTAMRWSAKDLLTNMNNNASKNTT